jgi:hypothetical protein
MSKQEEEMEEKMLSKAAENLGEFFDSVQIVVTRYDPQTKHTIIMDDGSGNLFARYGSTKEWLLNRENDMTNGVFYASDPDPEPPEPPAEPGGCCG